MDERKQDDQIADIKTFFVEEKINEDQTREDKSIS
jgi:hypothetical protein